MHYVRQKRAFPNLSPLPKVVSALLSRNMESRAVELVRFRKRGGIDFDKLDQERHRIGIGDDATEWPEEFDDPAFSRKVLGIK